MKLRTKFFHCHSRECFVSQFVHTNIPVIASALLNCRHGAFSHYPRARILLSCFVSAAFLTVSDFYYKPSLDFKLLTNFSFFSQKMHCFSYTRELEVLGFSKVNSCRFDVCINNFTFQNRIQYINIDIYSYNYNSAIMKLFFPYTTNL